MGDQNKSSDALMLGQIGRVGDMVTALAAIQASVEIDNAILTIQGASATGWIGVSSNKRLSGALLDDGTSGSSALAALLSQECGVYMMRSCTQAEIDRLTGFTLDIGELAAGHKEHPEWPIAQLVDSLVPPAESRAKAPVTEAPPDAVTDDWLNEVKNLIQLARAEQRRLRSSETVEPPVAPSVEASKPVSPMAVTDGWTIRPGETTASEKLLSNDPPKQRITMELRGLNASTEEDILGEVEQSPLAWWRVLYTLSVGGVCLLMAAFVVVVVLRSSGYAAALEQSRQQFARGEYDAAAHATDAYRGGLPNPGVGLLYAGMGRGMVHQNDDAIRELTASEKAGLGHLAEMALAAQQCRNGNYEAAASLCSRALDEHEDAFLFLLRAVCEDRLNRSDTALSDLRRAQKAQDAQVSYDAKMLTATILMKENRAEEALAPLTDIIQGNKDARALRMRAQIYEKLQREDLARADVKLAEYIETGL